MKGKLMVVNRDKENRKDLKTRSILASLNEGILVVDKDCQIILMNEIAEHIFGKQRVSVVGKDVSFLLDSSLESMVASAITTVIKEGTLISITRSIPRLRKTLKLSFSPFSDERKHFKGVVIVISDITQIDHEREEREAILSSTSDGIIFFDKNDCIIYANPAALEILGIQKEKVVGKQTSLFEMFGRKRTVRSEPVRCKEMLDCRLKECAAFNSEDVRCWIASGIFRQGKPQESFEA
ncbi:MAG: PAS domain S-box protein, partial [Candidatus Subteraquimicrobiales bacterium]|nr:PAS domain S-box protein [Candidatus Subteraquimicrobiales bacterium]